jgi:hypothetical protein
VSGNDGGGRVHEHRRHVVGAGDFPTEQFYHVATTKHIRFMCVPGGQHAVRAVQLERRRRRFGRGGGGRGAGAPAAPGAYVDPTAGGMAVAYQAGGGEPGYIAPDPLDPDQFYSGTNNGSYVDKFNRRTGLSREVNPYPWFYSGEPSKDIRERWQWTFPILFSPLDPKMLFVSSQRLWRTVDGGRTWLRLSGDLTRHAPETEKSTDRLPVT